MSTYSTGGCVAIHGGAQAKNVFWQVAGRVEVGTTSHLEGSLMRRSPGDCVIRLGWGFWWIGGAFAKDLCVFFEEFVLARISQHAFPRKP